jgi:hypothetical protein
MARKRKTVANAPVKNNNSETKRQPTAGEMRDFFEKNKGRILNYDTAENALKQLRDVQKTKTYRTITNYNKETIRTYLQNISSNEKNLRNLSRYLFYRCEIYYRLVKYYAGQLDLSVRSIIPKYSLTEDNDKDTVVKNYHETLKVMDEVGGSLQYEFFKAAVVALREDVFYGYCYYTEGEGMFILPLDPDYMKIGGVYTTGDYAPYMDMSYFRSNQDLLEYYGEPFTSMYNTYQSTGEKYQPFDSDGTGGAICLKFRCEDWETIVPVFAPMFSDFVSLLDLADIQAVVDEKQIYNLIWMEMETFDSGEPNDFKVDPEHVTIPYWNRMVDEALPDYSSYALIPGKLNKMTFSDDQASDVSRIEKATENILNTAGGAQVLNSSTVSGSTAFGGSMRVDAEFALSSLIPQIQAIVNRLLSNWLSDPCKVKFFEVSTFTKEEFKKSILESAQYGLPNKLLLNNINGFSELDTLALNFLEEDCLQLTNKFVPLQSSHVQSGANESGGQTMDDDEISSEGEASRDKKDNAKG